MPRIFLHSFVIKPYIALIDCIKTVESIIKLHIHVNVCSYLKRFVRTSYKYRTLKEAVIAIFMYLFQNIQTSNVLMGTLNIRTFQHFKITTILFQ